jgi:hypothetical protein
MDQLDKGMKAAAALVLGWLRPGLDRGPGNPAAPAEVILHKLYRGNHYQNFSACSE